MKKLLLLALVMTWNVVGAAQEPGERLLPPSIRVNAEAVVTASPDQAQLDIGVTTQAPTAPVAAANNAKQLQSALDDLRRALGPGAEIKTVSYTVNPEYRYPREGGKPTITGYTATNLVRVTVTDLSRIGQVIDAATQAGANRIHRLQFMLKDEQAAQSEALRAAAQKAKAQAETLAQALGLKVTRVLSVVESGGGAVQPFVRDMMAARADAAPTPVEPGTIEVRASVTLTVEVKAQ